MRITASVVSISVPPSVTVEHNGQQLVFSISLYRRTVFSGEFDIFAQINDYWADQSEQVQQAIFDIYCRVSELFDIVHSKQELRTELQEQIRQLLSYHDLAQMQDWIAYRAKDIQLPISIPTEFVVDVDRNTSIGKTYIAKDYRQLTTLSLALRCMIPIWGEYINSIKQETDDSFREMQAFQLVDRVLTPEVPAIAKLMDYIEHTINSASSSRAIGVFKGISSSDYPRWLLALVCIRCLAVGDIRGTNPNAHLVTFIHMFILSRISNKDETGDSKIKDKEIDDTVGEDNAGASALERYKIKANVAIGETTEIEYFLTDIYRTAKYLAPNITKEEIDQGIEQMAEYEELPTHPQVVLMRWLYRPIASPKSLEYLPAEQIKTLMGIGGAVLWNRGHHYLSILATCRPIRSEREMVVSPVDSKMRIPEPLAERLDQLFKYKKNQRNKKIQTKETNLAASSIDELTNNFMLFGWRPTVELARVEEVLGYRATRFVIKPDIKTDLARLVIGIQERSYLK